MNKRPTSKTTYTSTRGAKTPLSVISKYYNRASSKVDSPPVSGHYHGKCCTRHSSDKLIPAHAKPLSGVVKNQADPKSQEPQVTSGHSCQTLESTGLQTTPSENIPDLSTKFDQLSNSVVGLATSPGSVGVRSLESLLTKEFQTSLGTEINDPKYSQGFFQSTRGLIEKLVNEYEEGKINPRLIKEPSLGFSRHKFLKANSATSVCYKDRYFKELVMNVLQSMCSNDVEEELPSPPSIGLLSAASRERIRAIRDMVRVEAGLEPELFKQLDEKLQKLRRSLSQNRLEMLRATKEVERVISVHLMKRSSSSCVEIPQAAKTALKKNYKKFDKNSGCEEGCGENDESKECEHLESKNELEVTRNFLTSLKTFGLDSPDDKVFKCKAPDPIEQIRSKMTKMVEDELVRMKEKCHSILIRTKELDKVDTIEDIQASSVESCDSRSDTDFNDENETDDEGTSTFIQLLTADLIQDNVFVNKINSSILSNPVLEKIDEDEMDLVGEDVDMFLPATKHGEKGNINNVESNEITNMKVGDIVVEDSLVKHTVSNPESKFQTSSMVITPQHDELKKESFLDRFKSKWWSTDDSIASAIIKEMKQAFEGFGIKELNDGICDEKIPDLFDTEENESERKEKSNPIPNEFDFTIEQIEHVLVKIITKTDELTDFLKESDPKFSVQRKLFAYDVLRVLESCIGNPDDSDTRDGNPFLNDEEHVTLTIARICKAFSYLADSLNGTPTRLKNQPFSTLSPPQSMMRTLAKLASTEYFRDCFISVIVEKSLNYDEERTLESEKDPLETSQDSREDHSIDHNKDVKIVKAYDMNEQTSSGEISPIIVPKLAADSHSSVIRGGLRTKFEIPGDVPKNLANYEHYLGLSASVMTVQNLSDMFLYLSTVLNDIPHRIKGEKILSLNPPFTLRKALDILYSEDDRKDVDKQKSFASLTVQNVSDFFLTLSKTFEDAPPRVKNSVVLDLEPPKSLLKAIQLLTSLPYNSTLDSQEQILEEKESCSQEQFYDAIDTLAFFKCA